MENRKRILIVQDEAIISIFLKMVLGKSFEITGIADNARDAISRARDESPDFITMDIKLKGKETGIDAMKVIEKEQKIRHIYCTAFNDEQIMAEARTTYPAGIMFKPMDIQKLIDIINQC